jgi:hypothetical protein
METLKTKALQNQTSKEKGSKNIIFEPFSGAFAPKTRPETLHFWLS